MKKTLSWLLALLLICSMCLPLLAASAEDLEEVTLRIYVPGDDKAGKAQVLDNFYEVTKDRLNAHLEIIHIGFGDYEDKMMSLIASGDDFDACFAADWILYNKVVNRGALQELNELLPQYAPKMYQEYVDKSMMDACSVNGNIYAMPWTIEKCGKYVLLWRADLAEQYDIDMSNITTIEDVDRALTDARTKLPENMLVTTTQLGSGNSCSTIELALFPKYELFSWRFHELTYSLKDGKPTIVPVEQTELFRESVKYAKKWYDAGILSKNDLAVNDSKLYENGKCFATFNIMENAHISTSFADASWTQGSAEIYQGFLTAKDSPMNNALVVNANAAHPERVVQLMELLNDDQAVYDALLYGIKGVTYDETATGEITLAASEDASNPLWQDWMGRWCFWRQKFQRPDATYTPEYMEFMNAWLQDPSLIQPKSAGFVADTTAIKTEIAQRDQVYDEAGKLLLVGIIEGDDIDAAIDAYIEKQKAAGTDKIVAEVQAQLDAFLGK